jgi:hypothetical protein
MSVSKEQSLGESWFGRAAPRIPEPPPSSDDAFLPELRSVGRPGWAILLGAVGGGIGGAAMLFLSAEVARRIGSSVDVVRTIGANARAFTGEREGALLIFIVLGAALGALLGALFRYSLRMVPRLLAGAMLAPVLWTLVHAFVFTTLAPRSLGALPFGAMAAGAAVYGMCVALLRPPRERSI